MTWTNQHWQAFCSLVEDGWPGDFDDDAALAYRTLLDGVDPVEAAQALRRLLYRGNRFRPSAAELLAEMRVDVSRPTWDEAFQLIFGRRGVLNARPSKQSSTIVYGSEQERQQLFDDAAIQRADGMHPLIGSFIARQGLDRLRNLSINDPDWGEKHRRDLEKAWDQHIDAFDGRQVTAIAAGRSNGELGKLDPLAALNSSPNRLALPK